ncbi:hypothetical protein K2X30_09855 [bacterium]|jgi:hypothetical protein|nr:hypothetical protein [bacterium]
MTKSLPILLGVVIGFSSWTVKAAEIQLEHSYFEGGGWGTDGMIQKKLDLPMTKLPALYRTKTLRPKPVPFKIEPTGDGTEYFVNDTALIVRDIQICFEKDLLPTPEQFEEAKELFLTKMSGPKGPNRLMSMSIIALEPNHSNIQECDVAVVRGKWDAYPYNFLPDEGTGPLGIPSKVLGLYFKADRDSMPVITVHPTAQVHYDGLRGQYVDGYSKEDFSLDGRVLILHEVGHFLGLAHVKYSVPRLFRGEELSVMGLDFDNRSAEVIAGRFVNGVDIWKHWDLIQTSLYRSAFWAVQTKVPTRKSVSLSPRACVFPEEHFELPFDSHWLSQDAGSSPAIRFLDAAKGLTLSDLQIEQAPWKDGIQTRLLFPKNFELVLTKQGKDDFTLTGFQAYQAAGQGKLQLSFQAGSTFSNEDTRLSFAARNQSGGFFWSNRPVVARITNNPADCLQ